MEEVPMLNLVLLIYLALAFAGCIIFFVRFLVMEYGNHELTRNRKDFDEEFSR
nr:unnamed protein product [Callosobruchus analis]